MLRPASANFVPPTTRLIDISQAQAVLIERLTSLCGSHILTAVAVLCHYRGAIYTTAQERPEATPEEEGTDQIIFFPGLVSAIGVLIFPSGFQKPGIYCLFLCRTSQRGEAT